MESNDLLVERIREVNPIPNDDDSLLSTAALLTAIDERSGAVQTETVKKQPVKPPAKRNRRLLVAAAAFAIALGVVGIVALLTSGDDGPGPASPTTDAPTPTTAAPTPTTAPPTPTTAAPTTLSPEAAWEAIPAHPSPGTGRVRTTVFAVPFSFESGLLEDLFEVEDWLALFHPLGVTGGIDATVGLDTVDATVAALREIHDLYPDAAMTDPVPVTIGGAQGVTFETAGIPAFLPEGADHPFITVPEEEGSDIWTVGSFGVGSNDSGSGEIFVVDVDGQIVVIAFGASDVCIFCPSPPTPTQVETAKERMRTLVESIEWKDLG